MTTLNGDYRGLRALLLTRVSGGKQEEMYGHTWQEMQTRKLLIEPLGLQLDEAHHIIRDTYSGLEYRYREALDIILAMAERGEFDVLCMEVLDRGLGRKALAREIFRMQLRELGIRVLTTDPNDHADDDSLEGQLMRFIKGYKAEEEVRDFVRRSRGGKMAKATGDPRMSIPPRPVGNGRRLYGYKYILDEKGKRVGVELNYDVMYVEADGTEWTEVKVIVFIFESAANGMSAHQIASTLNKRGVPTPYVTMKVKDTRRKLRKNETPVWEVSSITQKLRQSDYWGERREFKTRSLGKIPGKKSYKKQATSEREQVIIAVPAIVSKELAEAAIERVEKLNKANSPRRNSNTEDTLLRSGYIRCGHCNRIMTVRRDKRRGDVATYVCPNIRARCPGCTILAREIDPPAWKEAVRIIRNPHEVDTKVKGLLTELEEAKQKRQQKTELATLRKKQASMRSELNTMIQEGTIDKGTRAYLTGELSLLAKQEEDILSAQRDEQAVQEKYNKVQQRLLAFYKRCAEWREKLDDPEFNPPYKFRRDAIEFFGITAIAYRSGSRPRAETQTDPPSIMSIVSPLAARWH